MINAYQSFIHDNRDRLKLVDNNQNQDEKVHGRYTTTGLDII